MTRETYNQAVRDIYREEVEDPYRFPEDNGGFMAQMRAQVRIIDLLAGQIKFDDEPREGETKEQFERRVGTKG